MTIVRLQEVDSSQIHSIGYDPETQTLAVRFTRGYGANRGPGSLYHYSNVAPADFEAFRDAESLGRHFGQHIKPNPDKFPYQKIVEADDQQKAA